MSPGFPWGELGLARGADAAAIRKAYAGRLKAMDVDADPDAYARLRQARDAALRQARQAPANPALPDLASLDPAPAGPVAWPLAGAAILGAGAGDLQVPLPDAPGPCAPVSAGRAAMGGDGAAIRMAWPFAPPVLAVEDASVRPVQRPEARLYALLLGTGAEDARPFTADEEAEAHACLQAILDIAAHGSLARHDAIETWLADVLARSWPRCAPLLEEVAVVLGWHQHAGQLGESRQVAFLTARLAGYLFQRDVLSPTHPHHAAWMELTREGEAGLMRRLTFRPARITALLVHVRQNFPELEDCLNETRVQSWFRQESGSWWSNWYVPVAMLGVRLLLSLWHPDEAPPPPAPPPYEAQTQSPQVVARMAQVVTATFGPGHTVDWLETHQRELAQTIATNLRMHSQGVKADRGEEEIAANIVRTRGYFAARLAGGAELDQAMRQRLAVLDRLAGDAQACDAFLRKGDVPPGLSLPEATRAAAQRLATAQAQDGRLIPPQGFGPTTATVPGILVGRVARETGLDDARLSAAMQGKGSPADHCAVSRALIRATLKWKGKEHQSILLTL